MLDSILLLGTEVAAFVEFIRTGLARLSFWSSLSELTQSLILQIIAFIAGAIAATAQGVNVFPTADPLIGTLATGVVAALPAQFIHVVLALLGVRAGVTAESRATTLPAQAEGAGMKRTYAPFL